MTTFAISFPMGKGPLLNSDTFRSFLPLKAYFLENRWALALGLFSLFLVDFLQLMIPLVIKKAIDSLTMKTSTSDLLLHYGLAIVAIAVLIAVFRYVWRLLLFGHSRKVEEALRNRLFSHLQTLSPSFYGRTKTGDLMARAVNDLNAVRMAAGMGLVALTDGVVLGLAAIGFMFYINPLLALISIVPAPILIYLSMKLARRMSTGYESVQGTFSNLTERVREAFAGIRVIKAYAREPWELERLQAVGEHYVSENMKLARTIALFFPMMAIFTNLGLAIIIWFGGRLTIFGKITTGDFVAFIGYLNLLTWPMMAMGWVTNLIQRGSASMRRINRVLDEIPEITPPSEPLYLPGFKGNLEIRGLSFRYPGKQEDALRNIQIIIDAGRTVALVGRVGSGKTTLLNALPRFLDIPEGHVFMDGVDIRKLSLDSLRKSMGYVTQDTLLFSDTIRNNALLGREGVTEEALEKALKIAQFYDETMKFDKGLDTLLGERGITLSGGQRQRLTIARALISDTPLLILDDALSMVDTRTEEKILNQVLETRKDKTNLIVSHRLSTISRADMILVMDKGRIVEKGNHRELMDMAGEYVRLYRRQLLAEELEISE